MTRHRSLQGLDLHSPSSEQVENNTIATLSKLSVVTFTAIGTVFPSVRLAVGGTDIVRGICQTDILVGSTGYITSLGLLSGVNTVSWPAGTKLFCSAGGALTAIPNGLPLGVVLRSNATTGVIYVDNTGITQSDLLNVTFPPEAELEFMWALAYPRPFKEFTYNGSGDITAFDIYETSAKLLHILNKTFGYDVSGNLTSIVTTNVITGLTKTRTITYDLNGQMISEDET